MFEVRSIRPTDFPQIYSFTLKLLRHHIGQCDKSFLDPDGLNQLFLDGFIEGLVLTYTPGNDVVFQSIGCMIFHSDTSPLHGGRGVYLDQFYIEPEFRGQGLGRLMMTKLCDLVLASNGQYIKLVYQDGLGLEHVYGKLGFINYSKGLSCLHLFEVYGKPKLLEFLDQSKNNNEGQLVNHSPECIVLVNSLAQEFNKELPAWSQLQFDGVTSALELDPAPASSPPTAKMVLVAEATTYNSQVANSSPQPGQRLCMFIEQYSVCSWLGPMITFSDFVGDTSILTPSIFQSRVQTWLQRCPRISGVVWEVPTQKPEEIQLNRNSMESMLNAVNVPDDTSQEGWNIVYLDRNGMKKLVGSQKSKPTEFCTCVLTP